MFDPDPVEARDSDPGDRAHRGGWVALQDSIRLRRRQGLAGV